MIVAGGCVGGGSGLLLEDKLKSLHTCFVR